MALQSTNCPYCIGYADTAGFHHACNCPTLDNRGIPVDQQFVQAIENDLTISKYERRIKDLEREIKILRQDNFTALTTAIERADKLEEDLKEARKLARDMYGKVKKLIQRLAKGDEVANACVSLTEYNFTRYQETQMENRQLKAQLVEMEGRAYDESGLSYATIVKLLKAQIDSLKAQLASFNAGVDNRK